MKKISSSLVASNATSSKAVDRIWALEAEVSCLRHHVSVLSKRLHKLDPPRVKVSRADSSPSPVIEEDILRSDGGEKTVGKEGVAAELPPVASGRSGGDDIVEEAEGPAVGVADGKGRHSCG